MIRKIIGLIFALISVTGAVIMIYVVTKGSTHPFSYIAIALFIVVFLLAIREIFPKKKRSQRALKEEQSATEAHYSNRRTR